jgi:hypothetical protein
MATEWFCKIMGEEWGPMSAQELIAVARRGRLTRDDNVKRGDQGTWVRAEVVRGLFNSPPIAATVTSDRLVAAVQRAAPAKRSVVLSIDPMRYWIKIGQVGTRVAGPFSADRVRQFAEQSVLKPFHLVSNDRRHWYRAVDARGLVFGGAAASAETVSTRSSVWLEQPVLSPDSSTATV